MYTVTRDALNSGHVVRFGDLLAVKHHGVVDVWRQKNGKKSVICNNVSEHTAVIRILETLSK